MVHLATVQWSGIWVGGPAGGGPLGGRAIRGFRAGSEGQLRNEVVGGEAAIVAAPGALDSPRVDMLDGRAVHLVRLARDAGQQRTEYHL